MLHLMKQVIYATKRIPADQQKRLGLNQRRVRRPVTQARNNFCAEDHVGVRLRVKGKPDNLTSLRGEVRPSNSRNSFDSRYILTTGRAMLNILPFALTLRQGNNSDPTDKRRNGMSKEIGESKKVDELTIEKLDGVSGGTLNHVNDFGYKGPKVRWLAKTSAKGTPSIPTWMLTIIFRARECGETKSCIYPVLPGLFSCSEHLSCSEHWRPLFPNSGRPIARRRSH